jgi:hypothetical protein
MKPALTLSEAIDRRLKQYKPLGWTPNRRRQIEVHDGLAVLTLGWLAADGSPGIWNNPDDKTLIRDKMVSVDIENRPEGVSAPSWSALQDTIDYIVVPSDEDVRAAAQSLNCRHVDKGESVDGTTIYWLVK